MRFGWKNKRPDEIARDLVADLPSDETAQIYLAECMDPATLAELSNAYGQGLIGTTKKPETKTYDLAGRL